MFTGVLPFDAAEPMDIALLHMNSLPPPPRSVRPELSKGIEMVILKALEKKPEDRYQTGRALAHGIGTALRKQPETIPPTILTIPERVTIGLVANPLAKLPPIPAAGIPSRRAADTETDPLLATNEVSIPSATGESPPDASKMVPAAASCSPGPILSPPPHPQIRKQETLALDSGQSGGTDRPLYIHLSGRWRSLFPPARRRSVRRHCPGDTRTHRNSPNHFANRWPQHAITYRRRKLPAEVLALRR